MKDLEDDALYMEKVECDKTYMYLIGLNSKYDQVRIQILGRERISSLNEVISLIRGEEN